MLLIYYFICLNIITLLLYGLDKWKAKKDKRRISEKTLIFLAVIGGAFGAGIGMLVFRHKIRKKKFYITIPVFVVLEILFIVFCLYQNLHIVVTRYDYTSEYVTEEMEGYKILQVSDLHNQFFWFDEKWLIDKMAEEKPDVIFVTGDVVDRNHTNYDQALAFFKGAVKIAPVYYISGNHEKVLAKDDKERLKKFIRDIKALGVHYLRDKVVEVDGYILVGISDANRAQPFEAIKKRSKKGAKKVYAHGDKLVICLEHEPKYYNKFYEVNADLAFTGHVHGGQIIIPGKGGLFSPEFEFFPELYEGAHTFTYSSKTLTDESEEDGEKYREEERELTMIISRGLGNSLLPLRINNYPELVVVTLHGN